MQLPYLEVEEEGGPVLPLTPTVLLDGPDVLDVREIALLAYIASIAS